jgi:hypothetical protein
MLNPYVDRSDSLNIQYGNPELNPEYVNSFDLGYSKFFGKIALTSSFFTNIPMMLLQALQHCGMMALQKQPGETWQRAVLMVLN